MTTDRAFIAALQQSAVGWPGAEPEAPPAPPNQAGTEGPHFTPEAPPRAKAPLSEHLARRLASKGAAPAAPSPEPLDAAPLRPGVEVRSFSWPDPASRLAEDARQQLFNVLSTVAKDARGSTAPAIAFVGTAGGIGTSTALLATAKLVESVGGKVAVFDTSPTSGAALALGVRRSSHPAGRIDGSLIDDLLVASRGGGLSVLAAGQSPDTAFAATAVKRLASTHDLVLIDAGDAATASAWVGGITEPEPSVLLLDAADGTHSNREQANQTLAAVGAAPAGFIETLADRC